MDSSIFHLQYAIDTFYFLVCAAFVMWMAAGFAMLEAGLVRAKNTTEILTKNIALYAVSCAMYMLLGYYLMYDGNLGIIGIEKVTVADTITQFSSRENGVAGSAIFAKAADFFFQVVFVATAMSIVSGAVAERMKLFTLEIITLIK